MRINERSNGLSINITLSLSEFLCELFQFYRSRKKESSANTFASCSTYHPLSLLHGSHNTSGFLVLQSGKPWFVVSQYLRSNWMEVQKDCPVSMASGHLYRILKCQSSNCIIFLSYLCCSLGSMFHSGSTSLLTMWNVPSGVGVPSSPTVMGMCWPTLSSCENSTDVMYFVPHYQENAHGISLMKILNLIKE